MNLGPANKKRVASSLQSTAVSALSISQFIACLKLVSPNSALGLGVQALSLAGVYVGTRWSFEHLTKTFSELPNPSPEAALQSQAVVPALPAIQADVPQAVVAPSLPLRDHRAPAAITPARVLAHGRTTRGFTKHMLDEILEAEQVLIPEKDRAPITTVNPTSIALEPINAYPKDEVYITECNHGLVINEYARHLISGKRFDNPYNRQPLARTDIDNLMTNKVIQDTVSLYRIPTYTVPAKRKHRQSADYDRNHQAGERQVVRRLK